MNPLGFRSAIYQLADSTALPMGSVTDDLFKVAVDAVDQGTATKLQSFVTGLAEARASFAWATESAASGSSNGFVAGHYADVARTLGSIGSLIDGPAAGHVNTARQAAKSVTEAVESGAVAMDGAIPEKTHMQLWGLRHDLDQAWNEIGKGHVLGTLR